MRVTTDNGQSGWGQISTYNSDIAATILHRNLAHRVLGKDPANHGMVTLFTLHLMRAIPNPGKYLEYSIEFEDGINREARAMYAPQFEIEGGVLQLPSAPGWGVTIHPDWLETTNYQVSELD